MSSSVSVNVPRNEPLQVVVKSQTGWGGRIVRLFFWLVLIGSLISNWQMYGEYSEYFQTETGPTERFHSGTARAADKIALIEVTGTISPPFTSHTLAAIKKAKDDSSVKGVLLVVDSPGGFVSDSHQIYYRLKELSALKPMFVQMKSMAASGGYYVSMGAGPEAKVFAEPTTWTGSIGVIIPHYEVAELATRMGIEAIPLKTGEFKDALSPFKKISDRDREVWNAILDQSFQQFIDVIDGNRPNMDRPQVQQVATGQIYTANDALRNGLIDAIGYEDEAIDALQKKVGIKEARVVRYESPASALEMLLGSAKSQASGNPWKTVLDNAVPKALYHITGVIPPQN